MHATIQKPMEEIMGHIGTGEKVFVVGCGNCAEKCRSGGAKQVLEMKKRLEEKGVEVTGCAATASGTSLCKLSLAKKMLNEEHGDAARAADSFLVLACGQGIHTVIDATGGAMVHPGCDTIFGGETVEDGFISEYCSLCGQCVIEATGGLCPMTLCSKGLLNGPCGGARDGKCEVDREQDCGWHLIYERLKKMGRLDLLKVYREPRDYRKWGRPRNLRLNGNTAVFRSQSGLSSVTSSGGGK